MSKYIVYCLNTNNHQLEIVSIEDEEKNAKNIQNSHSFNLLCNLNKNKSLYKLEIKENIIQIIEINIDIKNGWISNTITENKQSIYEIGIINYLKKDFIKLESLDESYVPGNYKSENMSRNTTYCSKTNSKSNFNSKRIDDISKPNIITLLQELKLKCKEKE